MRMRSSFPGLLLLLGSASAFAALNQPPLLVPGGVIEGDSGSRSLSFGIRWMALPGAPGPYQVQWRTVDGAALAGSDYVAASGTVSLSPQQSFAPLSVMVLGDSEIEPNEDIRLEYDVIGSAFSGSGSLWISDDDGAQPPPPPPIVLIQALDVGAVEPSSGETNVGVMLLRLGPTAAAVDVDFAVDPISTATHGSDWTGATVGRLSFAPGQTVRRIDLAVRADSEIEGVETIRFSLSAGPGVVLPRQHAVVSLRDAGAATGAAGVIACRRAVMEHDGPARFVVRRHGDSSMALSVNYATADGSARAGADYTASAGTLSWAAGDATPRVIDVALATDSQVEPPESFAMVLSNPQPASPLGPASAAVVILDAHDQILVDDFAPGCDD